MEAEQSWRAHLEAVEAAAREALRASHEAGRSYTGVLFHAGSPAVHHADDQEVPFRATAHFARFAPAPGPGHVVAFQPGRRTELHLLTPTDFWEEPPARPEHPAWEHLDAREHTSPEALREALGDRSGWAYVGNDPGWAAALGVAADAVEPSPLVHVLDWNRAFKTSYEVACLREAARRAGAGHAAVRRGVAAGRSEFALHLDFLQATGHLEAELPYGDILAWDRSASVLHYQSKRREPPDPGRTFLIDAGAAHMGYASDITRTYLRDGAPDAFRRAVEGVIALQESLVQAVGPGVDFAALHERSYRGVAEILCEIGALTVSPEQACDEDLVRAFYPHGLGHHIGLQVHDVGGRQAAPEEEPGAPPERFPALRTTRSLAAGHAVTIEPGLYFIPVLLEPFRARGAEGFDWELIDALTPSGGVRIEDDVLVTPDGAENLSRPHVPVEVTP